MSLRLYDSLTRTVGPVAALPGAPLGIYSCGPTVYDRIHVGNARPFVVAMTLRRHLERSGLPAKVVINITDVNDKIYVAATARGMASTDLAREMAAAYIADTSRLGLGRPDVEPCVTETMPEIIDLIARLVAAGHAYAAAGDVYFRVRSFDTYGGLSGQRPEELVDEARRIEPAEGKESPLDFTLWKGRKADEDAWWSSPWGDGRPGWHIECSAMAMKHLGETVDVHGGGLDLIFPHHENERAQSEGATGCAFARTWLHNGMLRFGGDKMSKSIGNVSRLADALDGWGAEALLMLFAQAHYRSPLEFSDATLTQATAACERLRDGLRALARAAGDGAADRETENNAAAAIGAFDASMDNDIGTPDAVGALFGLISACNRAIAGGTLSAQAAGRLRAPLVARLEVLGLGGLADGTAPAPAALLALARERAAARAAKDYARADALRDQIASAGFSTRDTPDGPELIPL
jgi:cysteinyl-tRNA synthetase